VATPGAGDDLIARLAADLPGRRLVITADRELRGRAQTGGAEVAGPRWLLGQLPAGPGGQSGHGGQSGRGGLSGRGRQSGPAKPG
jgi:hypothetical protein